MKTSITKVASLDTLSAAMDELYVNQVIKRADENFSQSAKQRLQMSSSPVAAKILAALNGTAPKGDIIDLADKSVGLSSQQIYALQGPLEAAGYQVHGNFQKAPSLQDAMRADVANTDKSNLQNAMKESAGDPLASVPNDNSAFISNAPVEFGAEGTPERNVGNIGGVNTDRPYTLPNPPGPGQHPAPKKQNEPWMNLDVPPAEGPHSVPPPGPIPGKISSINMLNALEKIANILGENGFELSEMVADELIESIVEESKEE